MAGKKNSGNRSAAGVTIQLHLLGIIVFSSSLVLTSALAAYAYAKIHRRSAGEKQSPQTTFSAIFYRTNETELANPPEWGQLSVRDIDLEQPKEYLAYQISTNHAETWTFARMTPTAVRAVMQSSGMSADQIAQALAPSAMIFTNDTTVVTPADSLVFGLSPASRAKVYTVLAKFGANQLMQFPFCFPGNSFATRVDKNKINAQTLALLQKALYPRGGAECFSDLEALLRTIPDEKERLRTLEALSHQSAVLLGIRVWPDSDVDGIINYWSAPGVRLMNVRPLLNSLKRQADGGYISILYFLPPFARQRLYTYPLPSQPGSPEMNCHWSTMNFFNATPDNRFFDPEYTVNYLLSHYYRIAQPSRYGDLVFLLDKHGSAVHSAVYLADDIVFTKNGYNSAQPWMLMHLKDLVADYAVNGTINVVYYRNKDW